LLRICDVWQWLGIGGDAVGTSGVLRRTFFYAGAVGVTIAAGTDILNVITIVHVAPQRGLLEPVIREGSSWITLTAFIGIPWAAWRLAPLNVRPRLRLLLHLPAALLFSLAHVAGFIALRKLGYWLAGDVYVFGSFRAEFLYELAKDVLAYALFVGGFALVEHLLRQQQLIKAPGQTLTFDIRDGTRTVRVRLSDILAVASAGNYVEFLMQDGRRLLMRSPLSAVEADLANRGFIRTHRSWLVNVAHMTELSPQGSGDYAVRLGALEVPLSRRFPAALARLRAGI
jgi:DNA-binding LytR/AlgR family response regulator